MCTIMVGLMPSGWFVRAALIANEMVFVSGAEAERAARRLD